MCEDLSEARAAPAVAAAGPVDERSSPGHLRDTVAVGREVVVAAGDIRIERQLPGARGPLHDNIHLFPAEFVDVEVNGESPQLREIDELAAPGPLKLGVVF